MGGTSYGPPRVLPRVHSPRREGKWTGSYDSSWTYTTVRVPVHFSNSGTTLSRTTTYWGRSNVRNSRDSQCRFHPKGGVGRDTLPYMRTWTRTSPTRRPGQRLVMKGKCHMNAFDNLLLVGDADAEDRPGSLFRDSKQDFLLLRPLHLHSCIKNQRTNSDLS